MSKNEAPIIEKYWERIGGTLILEFPAVKKSSSNGPRRIDAIILPDEEKKRLHWMQASFQNKDIIVVQAKTGRLGMTVMGQAFFSFELMKKFRPRSIKSVILCQEDDSVLKPLLAPYPHIEVVVIPRENL